jgi:UDP-N-acetylglucosamine--N-acetylmuramyl-(pentapeptide) pyrophosphoryl-undecaprenol N-acetylglucosamine transferase
MVQQQELSGDRLARELLALAADDAQRTAIAARAKGLARPDAAKLIVDKVLDLARTAN